VFFALVLFALVVVAGTVHRTGLAGIFALSFLSVLWLLVNKGVEHETLFTLSVGHGVTPLDAAGFAGLLLVVAQLVRVGWSTLRRGDADPPDAPREPPARPLAGDRSENPPGPI
jgi:hypothetical protein